MKRFKVRGKNSQIHFTNLSSYLRLFEPRRYAATSTKRNGASTSCLPSAEGTALSIRMPSSVAYRGARFAPLFFGAASGGEPRLPRVSHGVLSFFLSGFAACPRRPAEGGKKEQSVLLMFACTSNSRAVSSTLSCPADSSVSYLVISRLPRADLYSLSAGRTYTPFSGSTAARSSAPRACSAPGSSYA